MGRSAAERMRSYRFRLAGGRVMFHLQLDEVDTAQMLIAGGLLAETDADDRDKIAHALEQQIGILIQLPRNGA